MTIAEVFPNPTVKQVIFQITYPNLFFLETKIGDLQVAIMSRFPESKIAYRRLIFGDIGPDFKPEDLPKSENSGTIWQFINPSKQITLSVTNNSLDITSASHKTYNQGASDNFREIIDYVLSPFLKLISIPTINRVGLRYVDECPLPSKTKEILISHYNSIFPTHRFNIEDTINMLFKATIDKHDHYITYIESLKKIDNTYKLILDFDGFALKVNALDLMTTLDKLHLSISHEFENTIKEPVYEYMRQKGVSNVFEPK